MKIIIAGAGKVGYNLAENLSAQNHDVIIIDKNIEVVNKTSEHLDVICLKGNALSTQVMLDAGIKQADLLIATTLSDEINMLCSLTAKKLGVKHTVARIRNPEYADEICLLKSELELDMIINPEQSVAREISRLIKFPAYVNIETFSKGRIEMLEIKITREMHVSDIKLKELSEKIFAHVLIGAVLRNDNLIIPNGDFIFQEDDMIYVIGQPSRIFYLCKRLGIYLQKIKNVMIIGGSRTAYYLAKYLSETDIKIKIIELKYNRCVELSSLLEHTLIIHGDGLDENILNSENLNEVDALVALTDRDEENIISALLAKQYDLKKTIVKLNRVNYSRAIENLGIDNLVMPKVITANNIFKYTMGLQNAHNNFANTSYKLIDNNIEAVEFTADQDTKFLNIEIKNLDLIKNILIVALVRKNETIIPSGNDMIYKDDDVIIITKNMRLLKLNDIIRS